MKKHKLLILGTRGIPGKQGGFEAFAERLALHLARKGWKITVYCQTDEKELSYSIWEGINLVHIPVPEDGSFWSVLFDFKAAYHALRQDGLILTLGYNTAIFSLLYRLKKRVSIINVNGMEWWRKKWNALEKSWLYANERCAVWFSSHLIADHPQIKHYLRTEVRTSKPITVIPYSTEVSEKADVALLESYSLVPKEYALMVATPEPENSVLEIVSAFSQEKRNIPLVVLGEYSPETNTYHKKVIESASDEVIFVRDICNLKVIEAFQHYTCLYIHGNKIGEENSSLIEAISSGAPVLAHDNLFNSWIAGQGAAYFKDAVDCSQKLNQLLSDRLKLQAMSKSSLERYYAEFSDDKDLKAHEELFLSLIDSRKQLSNSNKESKVKSVVMK